MLTEGLGAGTRACKALIVRYRVTFDGTNGKAIKFVGMSDFLYAGCWCRQIPSLQQVSMVLVRKRAG